MSDIHRRLQRRPAMDNDRAARGMVAFRNRKLDFSDSKTSDKEGVLGSRKRDNDTSEDVYCSPRKKAPAQLPEKYALLESFYEGVETAVSLLGIRQQLCTFQAVCTTVEATTKRRFLQKHLAQIKYILPEALNLEYVNLYDSDSRSKKWELKIALLPMPAEAEEPPRDIGISSKKPKIETVQRRRAFHARLVKFASTHSEEDDVPQHPMPERTFNRISGRSPELPVATTCIPMEIVTASHRVEVSDSHHHSAASTHFSKSFKTAFSLKAGKLTENSMHPKSPESSPICAGAADTILPMHINRTPHRDVHTLVTEDLPLGTPHLAPSFSPFFSVKRSLSEPDVGVASENLAQHVDNMPAPSVQLTPMKRRHAGPEEEEPELLTEPVELQTPIKIIRTYQSPRRPPIETEMEMPSPSKRPLFSPAFKPHFSVSTSPMHPPASRGLLSTPVKASIVQDISWDVRTPGRCVPVEEECAGLKTPVKSSSSIPMSHSFKSPAPASKHQCTPCTPRNSESGESSVYVSYHVSQQLGSACCQGEFKSPAATPVKPVSSIRSLNFSSPKRGSKGSSGGVVPGSPCPCSPGMDVPSTPGMQTPANASRASRFRNKLAMKHSKLNLGPLFAQTSDEEGGDGDDDDCSEGGEAVLSQSCVTERFTSTTSTSTASGTPALRKSLSFASEVSEEDMSLIQGLPAHLVQSVMQEEMKVAEEKSKDIVGIRHRQQMVAGLPHLFNQLRLIFQSSNKSVFPYQELLSKVVSSNTEMTDRREVEERLKMLLELAPEWISAKKSLSGDMLYRVDKRADVLSIRKKLCGAQ